MKSTKKLPKKLSGAQNCKLRTKEDVEIIKLSCVLRFFIIKKREREWEKKKKKKKEKKISDLSRETIEKNSESNFIESETWKQFLKMNNKKKNKY